MDLSGEATEAISGPCIEKEDAGCEQGERAEAQGMASLLPGHSSGHNRADHGGLLPLSGDGLLLAAARHATKPPPSPLEAAQPAGFRAQPSPEDASASPSLDVKMPASTASSSTASVPADYDPQQQQQQQPQPQQQQQRQGEQAAHQPLYPTTSGGGIGFMSSMSAEALEAFDLPGYAKRHSATLTFPEKVSAT
jgi:predicted component of type VI protein secretion system